MIVSMNYMISEYLILKYKLQNVCNYSDNWIEFVLSLCVCVCVCARVCVCVCVYLCVLLLTVKSHSGYSSRSCEATRSTYLRTGCGDLDLSILYSVNRLMVCTFALCYSE